MSAHVSTGCPIFLRPVDSNSVYFLIAILTIPGGTPLQVDDFAGQVVNYRFEWNFRERGFSFLLLFVFDLLMPAEHFFKMLRIHTLPRGTFHAFL